MRQHDGQSRGFGYVTLDSPVGAARCIQEAQVIDGRIIDIKLAVPEDKGPSMFAPSMSSSSIVGASPTPLFAGLGGPAWWQHYDSVGGTTSPFGVSTPYPCSPASTLHNVGKSGLFIDLGNTCEPHSASFQTMQSLAHAPLTLVENQVHQLSSAKLTPPGFPPLTSEAVPPPCSHLRPELARSALRAPFEVLSDNQMWENNLINPEKDIKKEFAVVQKPDVETEKVVSKVFQLDIQARRTELGKPALEIMIPEYTDVKSCDEVVPSSHHSD